VAEKYLVARPRGFASLIVLIFLCHSHHATEQAALALIAILTFSFALIDATPILVWPLIRWALPPRATSALRLTISNALTASRARFSRSPASTAGAASNSGVRPGAATSPSTMRQPLVAPSFFPKSLKAESNVSADPVALTLSTPESSARGSEATEAVRSRAFSRV